MSKEPRYRSIGIFVIGACVLAVSCLLLFGRFSFFERTYPFICYFNGSLKGLVPGAPVRFRGAKVGEVKDVSIVYRADKDTLRIPVLLALDPAKVRGLAPDDANMKSVPLIDRLIQRGLRAQLGLDSIVTGQLFVQLDFMPSVPAEFTEDDDDTYPEIPTAPSPLDKIQSTLENIPLGEMVNRFSRILTKVDDFIEDPETKAGLLEVKDLIVSLRDLAKNLDEKSSQLLEDAVKLSKVTESSLKNIDGMVSEARPAIRQSQQALDDFSAMSRALRRLADLLERQPESLIVGKE